MATAEYLLKNKESIQARHLAMMDNEAALRTLAKGYIVPSLGLDSRIPVGHRAIAADIKTIMELNSLLGLLKMVKPNMTMRKKHEVLEFFLSAGR